MTPTAPPGPQDKKAAEKLGRKAQRTILILISIMVVAAVVGLFLSKREAALSIEPSSKFFTSLQHLEGGALSFEFRSTRDLPSGVGLSDWLDSVPSHDRIKSVHAEATVLYALDSRGDWD